MIPQGYTVSYTEQPYGKSLNSLLGGTTTTMARPSLRFPPEAEFDVFLPHKSTHLMASSSCWSTVLNWVSLTPSLRVTNNIIFTQGPGWGTTNLYPGIYEVSWYKNFKPNAQKFLSWSDMQISKNLFFQRFFFNLSVPNSSWKRLLDFLCVSEKLRLIHLNLSIVW
jgi:hypothetical protein